MNDGMSDAQTQQYQFFDEVFIQQGNLTIGNVLTHYFAMSPFYSNDSLNEFNTNRNEDIRDLYHKEGLLYRLTYVKFTNKEDLAFIQKPGEPELTEKILEGDEIDLPENRGYPLAHAFVEITRFLNRKNEDGDVISYRQAKYFMVEGIIYQSPDLYNLITSSLRTTIFHLREAIRYIDSVYEWNAITGFKEKSKDPNQSVNDPPYLFAREEYKMFVTEMEDETSLQRYLASTVIGQLAPPQTTN